MKTTSLLFLFLLVPNLVFSFPLIPNPDQTPGDLCTQDNPDFARFRYAENIPYCRRNVSYEQRTQVYRSYGIPDRCRNRFTIDHLIPLSMGGSNSLRNLWPEHKDLKATRARLEEEVFHELEGGRLTQKQAIQIILKAKLQPTPPNQDGAESDCDRLDFLQLREQLEVAVLN